MHKTYSYLITIALAFVAGMFLLLQPPLLAAPNVPQTCSGLFFSEYIEGSSYNKAVEIFNGTGAAVDLSAYTLELYSNGSATPSKSMTLSGTVDHGAVYVAAHVSANAEKILAKADATNGSVINFNGDDSLVLKDSGGVVVDAFGQIEFDPGSQWGSGDTSTKDHTLRRKASISSGDNNPNDAFDPASEWDGYAKDTFDGIGNHVAACAGSETAPYVANTTPVHNATDVAVDANIAITFSEAVNVSDNWFQLVCNSGTQNVADTVVSGGPSSWTVNPNSDFGLGDSCTVSVFAMQVTDQDTEDPPDTMTSDHSWSFSTVGAPPACSTIPQIQGAGTASPCLGARNNIEGCITGIAAKGFYYQDVSGDGFTSTSDAMYVYRGSDWTNPDGWQVGNKVHVSGDVIEFFDITEFEIPNTVMVLDGGTDCSGAGLPARVTVAPVTDPNADPVAQYEHLESMRAQMSFDGWVVGATKRFISRYVHGEPEIAFVDFGSSIADYSRVFESDHLGYQGISYLSGGLGYNLPDLDFGDDIAATDVAGLFAYNFDKYTLLVDAAPTLVTADNTDVTSSEVALDPTKTEFDLCNFNVENLFDHINDSSGDWGDWAPGYPNPGSAAGLAQYQAKIAELAPVFVTDLKSCMIVGVEEVEGKQDVYDDLALAVSNLDAGHTWMGVYVESGDGRDISQGFLYRDDVTLVEGLVEGKVNKVTGQPYSDWVDDGSLDFQRVMPHGQFRLFTGTDDEIYIHFYVAHFKSKRSSNSCSTVDCTDVREKEAADMRDILKHHQEQGEYAIGGGDFNDVIGSTPIDILDTSSDLYNLFYDLPATERWSYVFSGESEVLDHMYVTANLRPSTPGWSQSFSAVHVHADFPSDERASDHDPVRTRFSRCRALSAPSSLEVSVNDDANGVDLSWDNDADGASTSVWGSANPHFNPNPATDTPLGTSGSTSYTHANSTGNATSNYFYVITTVNPCDGSSAISNRVGEFEFALTSGT